MNRPTLSRVAAVARGLGLVGPLIAVPGWRSAGSASAATQPQSPAGTVTTIAAQAPVGQPVLVAVKTNPSTGYHWQVKAAAQIKVSSIDTPTSQSSPRHPLLGAPIIRVYQLTAATPSVTPYIVTLVELSPAGQPSGRSVVVTISTQP